MARREYLGSVARDAISVYQHRIVQRLAKVGIDVPPGVRSSHDGS